MGKEQVYFRDTGDKAVSRRDKDSSSGNKYSSRFSKVATSKKNISKKDSDKFQRFKKHKQGEKMAENRKVKEQELALKKLQQKKVDLKENREILK